MDRSRRSTGATRSRAPTADRTDDLDPPSSSRLNLRARKNRRRPPSLWSRVPPPRALADACGRALRRSLPAAIASGVLLGALCALWLGYRFVTTSSRYAITEIEVRGAKRLSADEVRAATPARIGDNVFLASTDEVARALRRHPWIAAASAQRVLPGTLVVEIREHEAAAVAVLGEPYLVGADGHPFKRARLEDGDGEDLPAVTGLDLEVYRRDPDAAARTIVAALDALARWRSSAARPPIGELHVGAQGTLTLRTSDRATAIDLGPLAAGRARLDERLRTFDAAWAELDDSERARARSFHTGARADLVTVAFGKD
jgi:cell division septal protein FtsQ